MPARKQIALEIRAGINPAPTLVLGVPHPDRSAELTAEALFISKIPLVFERGREREFVDG